MSLKKKLGLALLAAALPLLGACETTETNGGAVAQQEVQRGPIGAQETIDPLERERARQAEPAPAPVPARAAEPAPAATPAGMLSADLFYPTGSRATSALWVQKIMPREIRAGQPFEYDIKVTNLTGMTLRDVVVTDECVENVTFNSSVPPFQPAGPTTMRWVLGQLGANESKTIRVTATPGKAGAISSCTGAEYNSLLCLSPNVVQPALQLACTAPSEVLLCNPFELTYTVTNNGSGTARNVRVRHQLPANLKTTEGRDVVEFAAGDLAAGQSRPFSVRVKAERTGEYTTSATASADGNLTASCSPNKTVVRQPVLTITKSGPTRLFAGRRATFEITVTNTGDANAEMARIVDPLPAGTRFVSASDGGALTGNEVVWNLGSLAPRASKKVTVVLDPTAMGEIRNTAMAMATCAQQVQASATVGVEGIPAILLEVVDIEDPIEVGGNVTYVITVTNQGSAPGTNIRVAAELPQELTFVNGTGTTGVTAQGQRITLAPVATLAPKAKAEWRVVARANAEGDVRFKVSMTSDQLRGAPVEETESTNLYE